MKEYKIKHNLEDKFKQLLPQEDAPQELKKEVFGTIETLTLIGDIADLFTAKFSIAQSQFLSFLQNEKDSE